MHTMPKISFIVPVYNVEKYFEKCVDSILGQTFEDFEVILVDDGSPDNCPAICDAYARKDSRVRVIHKKNAGVDEARNSGIEAATGEWAYFVDSDDWLELDAAERLYKYAVKSGADCVMTDCVRVFENGSTERMYQFSETFFTDKKDDIEDIQKFVLCHKYSPHYSPKCDSGFAAPWGKFIKLSIIKDNNIRFDPYSRGLFDDGVYSLYVLDHVKKFYYERNNRHTYNYRILGNSITQGFKKEAIEIFTRGCELVDKFINETHKDSEFQQAEYCRRVAYFSAYLTKYFYSLNNPKTDKEVTAELKQTLSKYPFKDAFANAKISNLESKHAYVLLCGKTGFIPGLKLYARLKQRFKK